MSIELLQDLFKFYRKELSENIEGKELLLKLGITDFSVAEHFQLGYASGKALQAMTEDNYQELVRLDLAFRRSERFLHHLVMPSYDEENRLVDLLGIRWYPTQVKTFNWQKTPRGLIGRHCLPTTKEVIFTTTPLYALHSVQQGYRNIILLRSPDEILQYKELFVKFGTKKAYILARKEREPLMTQAKAIGLETEVLPLAVGTGETLGKDTLLPVGKPRETKAEVHASLQLVTQNERQLVFQVDDLVYRIDALSLAATGMRIQVRVERGVRVFLDRLDLISASGRRQFARYCARKMELDSDSIENHLTEIADRMEALVVKTSNQRERTHKTLKPSDQEEALRLLKQPGLLKVMVEAMERCCHFIGEESNKSLAFLAACSRLLPKPLGLIVRGDSGTGKSALLNAVAEMLPSPETLNFSRLTPASLFYMPPEKLNHKVLICDEYEGMETSEYALRTMMSSQRLSLASTIREGGKMPVTKLIEIPAKVAVLVSTTGTVNLENLSRFIDIRMDSSPAQTAKVLKTLASQQTKCNDEEGRHLELIRNMNQLLRPCTVEIPYAGKLTFSSGSTLARRQYTHIIGLISAHAALCQHQRRTETVNGNLIVQATREDYDTVYPLLSQVVTHFEESLTPAAQQVLNLTAADKKTEVTRQEVMETTGWCYSRAYRIIQELVKLDLLVPDHSKNGLLKRYRVSPFHRTGQGVSSLTPPRLL
jgi:nucleoside-triphosphatase THEP1